MILQKIVNNKCVDYEMQESQLYIPTKESSKSINNVQHNLIKK